MGAYPEWELGLQLFDEEFARTSISMCSMPPKLSRRRRSPPARWATRPRSLRRQFLRRDRAVAFGTLNIVPASTLRTIPSSRGATSRTSIPNLNASGARTSPTFLSMPCAPSIISSKMGTWPWAIRQAVNYEPNSWDGGAAARVNRPRRAFIPTLLPRRGQTAIPPSPSPTTTASTRFTSARRDRAAPLPTPYLRTEQGGRLATAPVVSHLLNIDTIWRTRAHAYPRRCPAAPARPTQEHLRPPHPEYPIKWPASFTGRKSGHCHRWVDSTILQALRAPWKRKARCWRSSPAWASRPATAHGSKRPSSCLAALGAL